LILCALMYLTMFASSINLSVSMLFRIIHILSILTGSNPKRRYKSEYTVSQTTRPRFMNTL
jgi:hypothetical protein